jgi:hypothetical protein
MESQIIIAIIVTLMAIFSTIGLIIKRDNKNYS